MKILIIATIILPIVLLVLLIGRRKPSPPRPRRRLIVASVFGFLAAGLSALLVLPFPELDGISLSDAAIEAFCQAAIPQECSKLLVLFLIANKYSYFDKPFHALIYALCIAMGFTAFQNLFIFVATFNHWTEADIIHAVLNIPGNYIFALFMGAFFSLAWVGSRGRVRNAILSLAIPIIVHGIYDIIEYFTSVAEIIGIILYIAFIIFYRKPRVWTEKLIDKQIERDSE